MTGKSYTELAPTRTQFRPRPAEALIGPQPPRRQRTDPGQPRICSIHISWEDVMSHSLHT
ncbi:uncharacterized protein N7469_003555 [Penicillium citrinum]|uniref:Uncharacterized protein n=2 Tax=Penicillium TaxID=5073 RepID=A0A9W9P5G3_PENCI|nr:uncharacterized protein N7469_003555 [Penicillium citrinum]KAJ5234387.1 hypothetical protein N7469_003555 [Penicillium citrinum]KAJ5590009.1 hypothetical protein N7450_003981 [Penicillium hetheringtonii]